MIKNMKNTNITFMGKVSKDLHDCIDYKEDLNTKQKLSRFYNVMTKHGIKQGTWSKDGVGRICNNFEWTMCKEYFMAIHGRNQIKEIFAEDMPKNLLAYGKQPKQKRQPTIKEHPGIKPRLRKKIVEAVRKVKNK